MSIALSSDWLQVISPCKRLHSDKTRPKPKTLWFSESLATALCEACWAVQEALFSLIASWQKCRDVVELPVNVLCICMSGSASIDGYKHFQTQVHHLLLSLFAPWIWSVARFIFLKKPWKLMTTVSYRMAVPFFSRWPGRVCWCSWHCWTKRRERRPRVSR